jgi:hypothetical protein
VGRPKERNTLLSARAVIVDPPVVRFGFHLHRHQLGAKVTSSSAGSTGDDIEACADRCLVLTGALSASLGHRA